MTQVDAKKISIGFFALCLCWILQVTLTAMMIIHSNQQNRKGFERNDSLHRTVTQEHQQILAKEDSILLHQKALKELIQRR